MEVSFRRGPRREGEGEDTVTLDLDVLPRVDDTILWDGETYDVRDVKWWLNGGCPKFRGTSAAVR
jgi:hypothetical protein